MILFPVNVAFYKLTLMRTHFLFWQPAEQVRKDKEEEVIEDIQEEKPEGGAAKRETKEVQTSELKAEVASQKATKKTKTVLAKVTLLDGTEFSCDLEVRQGQSRDSSSWQNGSSLLSRSHNESVSPFTKFL